MDDPTETIQVDDTGYSEDELIPVSALQHTMYCHRQVALIHVEQSWADNRYTAEGQVLHQRVDLEHHESRKSYRTEYAMAIRSLRFGLIGKADVVEFEETQDGSLDIVRPVEFKRGRTKPSDVDRVQLCAQALCLEEMLGVTIGTGQFYYLQEHRRSSVDFDEELRRHTIETIETTRQIVTSDSTPQAVYESAKCDRCSLYQICMPRAVDRGGKRVDRYVNAQIRALLKEAGE